MAWNPPPNHTPTPPGGDFWAFIRSFHNSNSNNNNDHPGAGTDHVNQPPHPTPPSFPFAFGPGGGAPPAFGPWGPWGPWGRRGSWRSRHCCCRGEECQSDHDECQSPAGPEADAERDVNMGVEASEKKEGGSPDTPRDSDEGDEPGDKPGDEPDKPDKPHCPGHKKPGDKPHCPGHGHGPHHHHPHGFPHFPHGPPGPHGPHSPHQGPPFGGRGGRGFGRGGPFGFGGGPGGGARGRRFGPEAWFGAMASHPLAQHFRSYMESMNNNSSSNNTTGNTDGNSGDTDDVESFAPPVDVFETEAGPAGAWIVHVAVPGAKKEDIGIHWQAEQGLLAVSGVVYRPGDEAFQRGLVSSERKVGLFKREVRLPPPTSSAAAAQGGGGIKEEIDGDGITARLEDGVLIVTVPRVEKEWTEVRKVDII